MVGINTGILTNARPLSAEQIKALEQRAIEEQEVFVYLNENKEICFTGQIDPDLIKDLAWHNTYKMTSSNDTLLTKKVYKKQGLEEFVLNKTLQKYVDEDTWVEVHDQSNFKLVGGELLLTSDGLIFNVREE